MTKTLTAALLAGVALALPGTPAFAADAQMVGMWAGGNPWGSSTRADRLEDPGTINSNTGLLDLNPGNFGVNNTYERTLYSGRYANNAHLAFAIAEQDPGLNSRLGENKPLYKPEFWPLVQLTTYVEYSDPTGTYLTPTWRGMPRGMPSLGAPSAIVAGPFPNELYFIYQGANTWRYVPTDCRPFDEGLVWSATLWNGHSVGCWEGNTLVVTSKGFTDQSWFNQNNFGGGIHSFDFVLEERFVVNANGMQVAYTRIVHDPMLVQPWNMGTNNMNRNTDPMRFLLEDLPFAAGRHLLEIGGGG